MKLSFLLFPVLFFTSFGQAQSNAAEKEIISTVVDAWHKAAAEANFDAYFGLMSDDAIFIGTDATENWNKTEFKKYAKPHFDKGKAWNFNPLQRNIYFSADKKTAWFDELLDTQMKICRGSGVLIKVKKKWKIAHYVLSISIPNEFSNEVIKLKANSDNLLIKKLKK
ncbi:nuclear transport factor 2 family protein [Flavobacterium antarcticum]|uniref:nuclear transport factor 2 family protein n=1 Tax=Flavobacterium antarcticum TaxID=271155 RepID=UPI00047A41B7|nr:nuclear transport factor 2 family protein [Flavobacterium antarcticum]